MRGGPAYWKNQKLFTEAEVKEVEIVHNEGSSCSRGVCSPALLFLFMLHVMGGGRQEFLPPIFSISVS